MYIGIATRSVCFTTCHHLNRVLFSRALALTYTFNGNIFLFVLILNNSFHLNIIFIDFLSFLSVFVHLIFI